MSSTPRMPSSRSQVLCPILEKPEDVKRNDSTSDNQELFCANRVKTLCDGGSSL